MYICTVINRIKDIKLACSNKAQSNCRGEVIKKVYM